MASAKPDPRVGVAALVYRSDGKLIFGRRKSSHGAGQWAFPGGHLEFGEEVSTCAEREVLEETGLKVKGVRLGAVTNSVWHDPDRHYITLFMICEMLEPDQQPQNLEPDKCEGWVWKHWAEVEDMINDPQQTEQVFLPIVKLLQERPHFAGLGA